jgi:hypothetical protein
MEYVAQDFEQLLINPYDHKIGSDLMKVFPILSKYKEFRVKLPSQIKREYVLRYIIYAFDRNSPLIAIAQHYGSGFLVELNYNSEQCFVVTVIYKSYLIPDL